MEWVETFSHDEGKPSENDGDVKLWFQTHYQFETCKISYHFCFDCYYWRPLHKSSILHKMHSYECDRTNNSHFLFKINSGIQLGDNQYFGFFGFIWVQSGVGPALLAARHWRRLNFYGPTTAFFENELRKTFSSTLPPRPVGGIVISSRG